MVHLLNFYYCTCGSSGRQKVCYSPLILDTFPHYIYRLSTGWSQLWPEVQNIYNQHDIIFTPTSAQYYAYFSSFSVRCDINSSYVSLIIYLYHRTCVSYIVHILCTLPIFTSTTHYITHFPSTICRVQLRYTTAFSHVELITDTTNHQKNDTITCNTDMYTTPHTHQ